jgi:hypothetical protein
LKDGRVIVVRGQGLKYLPGSATGDGLLYGIVNRSGGEEIFVALVKSSEVIGIFHGEVHSERKTA